MRPVTNDGCLYPSRLRSFAASHFDVLACLSLPVPVNLTVQPWATALHEPYSARPRHKGHCGTATRSTRSRRYGSTSRRPPPLPARMARSSCAARRPIPVRSLRSIESPSRTIFSKIQRCRCRCRALGCCHLRNHIRLWGSGRWHLLAAIAYPADFARDGQYNKGCKAPRERRPPDCQPTDATARR